MLPQFHNDGNKYMFKQTTKVYAGKIVFYDIVLTFKLSDVVLIMLYLIGEKMSGESDENFEGVAKFSPDE